jgi:tRNA(adenine34) deaminase
MANEHRLKANHHDQRRTINGQQPIKTIPDMPLTDELWMEEALRCAQRALEAGEVPVGAIVVRAGEIVGRGWNRNISDSDPTAHAEVLALREAGASIGNHRLGGCELFVTIEPCAMCAGAMIHARIKRLVYGAHDPKAGAVGSVMQVLNHPQLNHKIEVQSGVLAGRSAELLQTFFRGRR